MAKVFKQSDWLSNTQTHFQILNMFVDQRTWPSIRFKTHDQTFQTLSWAFQTLQRAFKATKKKSLAICLCYSTAHAVASTLVVFSIYPEAYCQTLKQTLSKKIAKNIFVHTETNEQPACYLIAQRWKTWFAVAVTPKFFLVSWNNKVIFGLK